MNTIRFLLTPLRTALLTALAAASVTAVFAQSTKAYSDQYGVQGKVTFTGTLFDTILPEKGPYLLQWRKISGDTLRTYKIEGRLRNHRPHGTWTREEADWKYTIEPGRDIAPAFAVEGTHQVWRGNFSNGKADGTWRYAEGKPPADPANNRTPLRMEIPMKEGRFSGKFTVTDRRIDGRPVSVTGHCNAEGVAVKTWIFKYFEADVEVTETLTFDRGILTKRTVESGGSETVDEMKVNRLLINAAEDSAAAVCIGGVDFGAEEVPGVPGLLTSRYLETEFNEPLHLDIFPFDYRLQTPIFKRFEFPFSEEEIRLREKIEAETSALLDPLNTYFSERSTEIERARSAELDMAVAYLETARKRLITVDSLMQASRVGLFTYIDRNHGGADSALAALNATSTARGKVYENDSIALASIDLERSDKRYFQEIAALVNELGPRIEARISTVNLIFADIRKEGELKDMETAIAESLTELDSLYANLEGLGADARERWVKGYLRDEIKRYANIDDYNEARAFGRRLSAKIDTLAQRSDTWREINRTEEDLDEGYRYFAYNPYTGERDIELKVKARFIRNVKSVAVPHVRNEIAAAGTWKEWLQAADRALTLKTALLRFAFLDERPDRRIERRLRREDQPERMIRIFMNHMEGR